MPTRELTSPTLAYELRDVLGRIVRRMRAEPGPAVGRMAVLGRLDRGGPASVSDLAASEHMRPQSMAQTIRELEDAALVSRRPDPSDGRRAFVELTSAGVELIKATRARRETWLAEALERELDVDERTILRRALPLLSRIADA